MRIRRLRRIRRIRRTTIRRRIRIKIINIRRIILRRRLQSTTTAAAAAIPRERQTPRGSQPRGKPDGPEEVRPSTAPAGHGRRHARRRCKCRRCRGRALLRQGLVEEALRLQRATSPVPRRVVGAVRRTQQHCEAGKALRLGNGAPTRAPRWCAHILRKSWVSVFFPTSFLARHHLWL